MLPQSCYAIHRPLSVAPCGQHQTTPFGKKYPSVIQPNHIESIVMNIQGDNRKELWKLTRYFDNDQFWSDLGVEDVTVQPIGCLTAGQWITHLLDEQRERKRLYPVQSDMAE